MRRHIGTTVGICLGVLLLVGSTAWAGIVVDVKVPFAFMVKGKEMPAGNYEISEGGQDNEAVTVQNLDTGASVMEMITTRLANMGETEAQTIFDKAGSTYYLSEVRVPGLDGIALAGAPGKHTHTRLSGTTRH